MFITSATSNVTAILTRDGKQRMANNSAIFKISSFKFSDDEINYSLYDGSSSDAANSDILGLPLLEPCSNNKGFAAQRYELESFEFGTTNVSQIITNIPTSPFSNGSIDKSFEFYIKTLRGFDSNYYIKSSDNTIVLLDSNYVDAINDPDISQVFQHQSYAKINFTIKKFGKATIQINGSNSKSSYITTIEIRKFDQKSQIENESPQNNPPIRNI